MIKMEPRMINLKVVFLISNVGIPRMSLVNDNIGSAPHTWIILSDHNKNEVTYLQ